MTIESWTLKSFCNYLSFPVISNLKKKKNLSLFVNVFKIQIFMWAGLLLPGHDDSKFSPAFFIIGRPGDLVIESMFYVPEVHEGKGRLKENGKGFQWIVQSCGLTRKTRSFCWTQDPAWWLHPCSEEFWERAERDSVQREGRWADAEPRAVLPQPLLPSRLQEA